ncbi:MAG: hypothetical protein AAF824_09685 [Bacteroidota bacterium]
MKKPLIPWFILSVALLYIWSLTRYDYYRKNAQPVISFYDTTHVHLHIHHEQEPAAIYALYTNLIEGSRKIVQAVPEDQTHYVLSIPLNSPRPIQLYCNEEVIPIFVIPDSSLYVDVVLNPIFGSIDSLSFYGFTAPICRYQELKRKVEPTQRRLNILDATDFSVYVRLLDSIADNQRNFLLAYQEELPPWFEAYEESEIAYHKAYLKLSHAFQREVDPGLLDSVAVNNSSAIFSYYYYLYLRTLIRGELLQRGSYGSLDMAEAHLETANQLLEGEVKDFYLVWYISDFIRKNNPQRGKKLTSRFSGQIEAEKYKKYLLSYAGDPSN